MKKLDLSRLLNPKTIAVIGGKECERVIEQCDKLGFQGVIWPVNPKRKMMGGRACFQSVEALPQPPDAAYVAVNRERSIDVVAALQAKGAGGAVCYAAGFAEAETENSGSRDLQQRLIKAAKDMPIIGPNCYGFINGVEKVALWPDQHGAVACDQGVAIITQSSNIAINLTMQKRGLPLAYVMTAGNQAQIGLSQLGMGVLHDERVTALGLHIEGLDDLKDFEALALCARELKKPIVVLKVGKSEQAQSAALTHTASLAGSDIAHDALFKRLGVARVARLESFLESLKLLHCGGVLHDNRLLSLSCSGGEASLMADAAEAANITFPPFSQAQALAVKAELGEIVTVANPLDYNTFIWGDWAAQQRMFEAALAPQFDLALLVNDYPRRDRCHDDDWQAALQSFIDAIKATGARGANVASLAENMPEVLAERLMQEGIAPLCGIDNAIEAADAAAFIGAAWQKPKPQALCAVSYSVDTHDNAQTECATDALITLTEHASKQELLKAGLTIPNGMVVEDMEQIEQALITLQRPLAVKAMGVAHKSENGAVQLNLHSNEEIILAIQKMARLTDQFLLEEMSSPAVAELIIGVSRDDVCGLLLTIGAGGVLTELFADTATLLLPTHAQEIDDALKGLRLYRLLQGYRGAAGADMDGVIAAILSIANYAVEHANSLEELDVNPLFAQQSGSIAVDALIVKRNCDDQ